MSARLNDTNKKEVIPVLKKEFGIENPMAIPRVEKVVLNMGIGESVADSKKVNAAMADLAKIAGQKPVATKAVVEVAPDRSAIGSNRERRFSSTSSRDLAPKR